MITLDISNSEVRILETDGDTVTSWVSHTLDTNVYDGSLLENPSALGVIIKELLNSSGIKGNRVTTSINGLFSLSRILAIPTPPQVPVSEEAVREAVENILPVSADEVYLFWHSLSTSEGGHQVLTHAVPKETIDNTMQALKSAGLVSRVLDLRTIAVARAVSCENGLILNIDSETFDIIMVIDGLAEVIRTTAWQDENLSQEEQAEYLSTSIDTTVSFYNTTRPNFPFSKSNPFFITGQMSGDIELVRLIRERLEYTEGIFKPQINYPEHFPVSQFAANIGLALKGNTSGSDTSTGYITPDMDMIPKVYRPWKPTRKQVYLSLGLFLALALLLPLYQVTTAAMDETKELEKQYTTINNLMELRKAEIAKRDPLRYSVEEYHLLIQSGDNFLADYETIKSLSVEYDALIGPISHLGDTISFSCETENYQVFRQFVTALEESGRFLSPITPPEGYPYIKSGNIKLEPASNS